MTERAAVVTVSVHDEQGESGEGGEPDERWRTVAHQTILGEGVMGGTLDLILVDRSAMRTLNREHMGVDRATDVLAFPLDGPEANGAALAGDQPPRHLGDVVVCPAVARAQARGHAGAFDAEMTLLIVHGILHVLGHDHREPEERRAMQCRERHHLARYGYEHPAAP